MIQAEWAIAEDAWGSPEPLPVRHTIGTWSWELRGDEIADVSFDGTRVLRMVRVVARDRDWNTVPITVSAPRSTDLSLEFDLEMVGFGADISATVRLDVADALRISVSGVSNTAFDRNRLGFVVLHPPNVAGAPLAVVSPDGSRRATGFPTRVSPHQPAFDIAALEWQSDGLESSLRFEGETFEMEDQRNWTDASFKTYSTPLALPFPVALDAGHQFRQALELACERVTTAPAAAQAVVRLRLAGQVPDVVVGASTAAEPAPGFAVPAAAVLVEVETEQTVWPDALTRAARTGLPLDVRIVTSDPSRIDGVLEALRGLSVVRVAAFSADTHVTEPELWTALVAAAAQRGLEAQLVAGTRAHFTELNRTQERLAPADAVTFSITPQMHARERAQLVESIAMQAIVARDAGEIAGGRPLHVGPITLRPRFNAVSTTPRVDGPATLAGGYGAALDPTATDERQHSTALAAWTVASFAALAGAGVASICYFEEWGDRGILDANGVPFPVHAVIAQLNDLRGQLLLVAEQDDPTLFTLGAVSSDTVTILAANLAASERTLEFESEFASGGLAVPAFSVVTTNLSRRSANA